MLILGPEELFCSDSVFGVVDLTFPALDRAPCEGRVSPPEDHIVNLTMSEFRCFIKVKKNEKTKVTDEINTYFDPTSRALNMMV